MAILDDIQKSLKPDDTQKKEQLFILKKAATGELREFLNQFNKRIQNPDAFKGEILPLTQVASIKEYRVGISDKASDSIGSIVDNFFEGDAKEGFKEIIKFGLKSILGSSSIGEQKSENWYVTLEYGSIMRVDVFSWRYNFSSEGFIDEVKNAFCFAIIKSFADIEKFRTIR